MDDQSELKMLQYYRHDIMNELQLVQGYLHMGKISQVKQKINDWFNHLNEEQKLFHTNGTQLIKWLLMFNHVYDQYRLSYEINTETTLQSLDDVIVNHCHELIEKFKLHCSNTELYDVHINISEQKSSKINLHLRISGLIADGDTIINEFQEVGEKNKLDVTITKQNNEIMCNWTYTI